MRNISKFSILFSLVIFILITNTKSQSKPSFYPDIESWGKNGQVEIYGKKNLYDYIDGGATLYINNNFKKLSVMEYTNDNNNTIVVEIYEHGSENDARFIYNTEKTSNTDSLEIKIEGYMIGSSVLNFIKDKYYVKMYSHQESNDIKTGITQIASLIENKL
jgi:hypothetical protein